MESSEPIPMRVSYYRITRIVVGEEEADRMDVGQEKEKSIWFKFLVRVILRSSIVAIQSTLNIRCERFLREGADFLLRRLSNPYLSDEELERIIESAVSDVKQIYEGLTCQQPCRSRVFSFAFDIVIDFNQYERAVVTKSLSEIRTTPTSQTPASASASESSLRKVKLSKQCKICMLDFDFRDGAQLSAMPCGHTFHHRCIVSRMPTCPLC